MTSLGDLDQLAFWYFQPGVHHATWSGFDRTWAIGDAGGTPVGAVEFDGRLLQAPRLWVRDLAGAPAIGLTVHRPGLFDDAVFQMVWPDGQVVGSFAEPAVWWGQQQAGQCRVQIDLVGRVGVFGGAWLWDAAGRPVAAVTQRRDADTGSQFLLTRQPGLDEVQRWVSLAFPLAVYTQLWLRESQDRHHDTGTYRDTTDLL